MSDTPHATSSGKRMSLALAFWCYAILLVFSARWIGHHLFHGWLARLATMAGVAVGLIPWAGWLSPRITRVVDRVGRVALIGCYFTLMLPFAIVARLIGDPLARRRTGAGSRWVPRQPLADTLDAARMEA